MRKRLLILLCAVPVLIGVFRPNNMLTAQTQKNYVFAYAAQPQFDGQVFIKTIDPINPNTPQLLLTLTIPANSAVEAVVPSLDGNWFAMAYTVGVTGTGLIRLVNLITHQTYDIPLRAVFTEGDTSIAGPSQYFAWSPNSRYLALTGYVNNLENTYLYDVQTNNLTALNADTAQKFRVAWSLDSTRLATLSEYCIGINSCSDFIETFSVPTLNRLSSIKIADVGTTAFDIDVCQLAWSPAATFISYVTSCDASGVDPIKEVYILNVLQRTITPVTNYTAQTTDPTNGGPPVARIGDYDTRWFDPHTLLVGAVFRNNAGSYSDLLTQTIAVRVTDNQTTVMSAALADDWAINPRTGELAYRSSTLNSKGLLTIDAQNASVQFSFLVGSHVLLGSIAPPGCDLKWSPAGTFLAYDQRSGFAHDCRDPIQGFVFIDDASHTVKRQAINPSENDIEIGWLSFTASNTPPSNVSTPPIFPTATPAVKATP